MLLEIVDKTTEALEEKASVRRELDEIAAETAIDRLAWDDTPEGERLARYELTCKRAWNRTFDLLIKVRDKGKELDFAMVASLVRSLPAVDTRVINPCEHPIAATAPAVGPADEPVPPNDADWGAKKRRTKPIRWCSPPPPPGARRATG